MKTNELILFVDRLPSDIQYEIKRWLIPDIQTITFCKDTFINPYNKYYVALFNENIIQNKNEFFLTRISKKNGKHQYYITKQIIIETEYNIVYYDYYSIYVGKDIINALFKLLL
jgi:hypothetical protein